VRGLPASPADHVLMTLAIKRAGKFVDLEHIREKLCRDAGREFTPEETKNLLDSLASRGLVQERDGEYALSPAGRDFFERRWREIRDELNQDYLKVYRAKRYYPQVSDVILDFCRDRYVSVFRLFTGRAWLQRKLGPKWITIKSEEDIQYWLDIHGIDFIPYIHRIGSDRPDWLVIDFDAGRKVSFDQTKKVVAAAADVLAGYGVEPAAKFSGSRGFPLWGTLQPPHPPGGYAPDRRGGGEGGMGRGRR